MSVWLLYPFTLGLVAAVNPCGFPLLPIYLSLFIEGQEGAPISSLTKVRHGLSAGVYATAGFVLLFGITGVLTEAGLSGTYSVAASWARYPLAVLGVILALYGIATIAGRGIRFRVPHVRPGLAQRRPLAIGLFGISYGIASLGCSLPLFLGGVASTFTHRGTIDGLETFVAYSLGMGLFLTVMALLMSLTDLATVRKFRLLSPLVGPIGGLLLCAIGVYVAVYWISAIVDPLTSTTVLRFIDRIQSDVATYLQFHASGLGIFFGSILFCGALAIVYRARSPERRSDPLGDAPNTSENFSRFAEDEEIKRRLARR